MIILDSDICISILRGNKLVIEKRESCDEGICISFMTVAELYYGAEKSNYRKQNINLVERSLLSILIIDSDIEITQKFGELKARLSKSGRIIADADLFIASTAITKCTKLITGNIKHYNRIDELKIENWLR